MRLNENLLFIKEKSPLETVKYLNTVNLDDYSIHRIYENANPSVEIFSQNLNSTIIVEKSLNLNFKLDNDSYFSFLIPDYLKEVLNDKEREFNIKGFPLKRTSLSLRETYSTIFHEKVSLHTDILRMEEELKDLFGPSFLLKPYSGSCYYYGKVLDSKTIKATVRGYLDHMEYHISVI